MVLLEQLEVRSRLVVVAAQKRLTGDLDEVLVADVVLCEQDRVVIELLAGACAAARVIGAAGAIGAFGARLVCQVDLASDDRLDPGVAAALVELEDPVHVAVIGDSQGRLTVGNRRVDGVVDTRGTVEHRILGMDMQMGERISQADSFSMLRDLMLKNQNHIFVVWNFVVWNLSPRTRQVHTRVDIGTPERAFGASGQRGSNHRQVIDGS